MKAILLLRERVPLGDSAFAEVAVWRLPRPLPGSSHSFKYRLAFVVRGICVLRYDNELGKGDHRHDQAGEKLYVFTTPERLIADFWGDVDEWEQ